MMVDVLRYRNRELASAGLISWNCVSVCLTILHTATTGPFLDGTLTWPVFPLIWSVNNRVSKQKCSEVRLHFMNKALWLFTRRGER